MADSFDPLVALDQPLRASRRGQDSSGKKTDAAPRQASAAPAALDLPLSAPRRPARAVAPGARDSAKKSGATDRRQAGRAAAAGRRRAGGGAASTSNPGNAPRRPSGPRGRVDLSGLPPNFCQCEQSSSCRWNESRARLQETLKLTETLLSRGSRCPATRSALLDAPRFRVVCYQFARRRDTPT